MIHTPEDYIHVLGAPDLNLTPAPNTSVEMIRYKLGENTNILFFNDRDQCLQAWAAIGH